jgi:pimeloyl-ACP methyl ester carboxylesterase
MSTAREGTLRVPGASLFYRVNGAGPLLLFLPGGDGDADTADALRAALVDRYTVVTYDRRGLSRSTIDPGVGAPTLTTHSDDVHHWLAVLTTEPAHVLGSSIGAVIGLDLVSRHPEQVRTLVAHEPPVWQLLSDAEREAALRRQQEVENTFAREGAAAAMAQFAAFAGVDLQDREPGVTVAPPITPQRAANLLFFFTHDAPAGRHHRLDLAALRAAPTRIVPAAGRAFPDSPPHRCAIALASHLGTPLVDFPGGHTGWLLRPKEFAATLRETLQHRPSTHSR